MVKPRKDKKTELRPDAWERFGLAVDAAIKSGPKHRAAPAHGKRQSTKSESGYKKERRPEGSGRRPPTKD
jgi:hypothetical protein